MRVGVISDIHGCLVGLRTALAWLDEQGIDKVVCAGDVAAFGPQPNQCIAVLAERAIPTAMGNEDDALLREGTPPPPGNERLAQIAAITDWSRRQLTAESRAWLAALPLQVRFGPDGLVVHGAPGDFNAHVTPETPVTPPAGVRAIVGGHLHQPFVRRHPWGLWVNAGSVGRPCDGDPRAAVAVLTRLDEGWEAAIYRIPFDLEAAAEAIRAAGMPHADRLVETQVKACWW